jgi:hypothetical protein
MSWSSVAPLFAAIVAPTLRGVIEDHKSASLPI